MLPFGPRATLHNFGAQFFSVDLGTSQYLYTVITYHITATTTIILIYQCARRHTS